MPKGDARGVIQTFPNKDLRQYKNGDVLHAERSTKTGIGLNNKDLTAVIHV